MLWRYIPFIDGTRLNTDTHWASKNGTGSFNWRMVFPIEFPLDPSQCAITFQAWDKDIITADDHIAEADLDFTEEALEAFAYDKAAKVNSWHRSYFL